MVRIPCFSTSCFAYEPSREVTHTQVSGYPHAYQHGFPSRVVAQEAWAHAVSVGNTGPPKAQDRPASNTPAPQADDQAFWAVLVGDFPGVYRGL